MVRRHLLLLRSYNVYADVTCASPLWLSMAQAADRFNINRQWEHLQAKYVGTGHADTTKLCAFDRRRRRCAGLDLLTLI